ncbi:hypothetical protein CEXT_398381 [Caerostris extrusa]|uniref:Uncharacterized protein n=1 Tax=Caerostris extrusa TaxID=172846 RepID=A0AAV4RS71_CAEEX|nr:hypothetical protein CEXT_398381 [Caerostris extrusa]
MDDCQNESRNLKELHWQRACLRKEMISISLFAFRNIEREPFVKVSVSAMTSTEPIREWHSRDCLYREWASLWEVNFKAGL